MTSGTALGRVGTAPLGNGAEVFLYFFLTSPMLECTGSVRILWEVMQSVIVSLVVMHSVFFSNYFCLSYLYGVLCTPS